MPLIKMLIQLSIVIDSRISAISKKYSRTAAESMPTSWGHQPEHGSNPPLLSRGFGFLSFVLAILGKGKIRILLTLTSALCTLLLPFLCVFMTAEI